MSPRGGTVAVELPYEPATPLSQQVRLRQIRGRLPESYVLLLDERCPPTLRQFGVLAHPHSQNGTFLDIGLTQPVLQTGLTDAEVGRDLLDRPTGLTTYRASPDIMAEHPHMALA